MTHQKNLQLCPDSNSDLKWSKIDLLSIFDGRLSELWNDLVKNGELIGKIENQGKLFDKRFLDFLYTDNFSGFLSDFETKTNAFGKYLLNLLRYLCKSMNIFHSLLI